MAQTADIFSNFGNRDKNRGQSGGSGRDDASKRSQTLRTQSLVSLISQFGLTAIGFLSTIYFTRTVDPSIVGVYFLFFSYNALFYLFSESGIGEAGVKLISEGRTKNEYYSASMVLRLVYLMLVVALLLISSVLFPESTIVKTGILWWIIAALLIDYFYNSRIYAAYSDGKVNAFQVSLFLNTAVRSLFQIVFVWLGYHSFGLMGGFLAGMIAAAVFAQFYTSLKLVTFSKDIFKRLLTYAVLIFLVMSCYLVYQNIDVVFIGEYLGETEAGIYRIVYQFSMLAGLAAISMKAVLYPKFSAWNENGQIKEITIGLQVGTNISLMLAIPIFFSFLVLGSDFISLFYGAAYMPGVVPLYLLSFIQVITVFMYLQGICLNAVSHPKFAFLSIAAGILANIVLNAVLIPDYGMEGAAIATIIAMTLNSVLSYLFLKKVIPVSYNWKSAAKMVAASLIMCAFLLTVTYFIPVSNIPWLLVVFTAGGLLYGLILLKIDKPVHDEVASMVKSFGVPWPRWL
ncbi:lipid II flippase MurJ [Methanosarcinaceae archaeon Ag5]|uniref:Lipid II flippase MurJ n=1 Tax=Methanolapillus africanus TaxID=3028297 RepID=A0AAE4SCI9_9EURY|nr:lipid II flippase MurJ [Methanosarcinaceae archaeon Ag5]